MKPSGPHHWASLSGSLKAANTTDGAEGCVRVISRVTSLGSAPANAQRLDGSRPLASCYQRRNRLHQPHHTEEITLGDVMNDRPVAVRFEEVLGSRLHQVGAEPAQSLGEPDSRRRLVVGYLTAERAHPRGIQTPFPGLVDRQRFGRSAGRSPYGASIVRNHRGPPTAQTRRRWAGRSSCAPRIERY